MSHYDRQRAHKRIPVRLQGRLTNRYQTYAAPIKNISKHGLCFVFYTMPSPLIFDSNGDLEVMIHISIHEKLKVSARKAWYKSCHQDNYPYSEIGIEISNPSAEYIKFSEDQMTTSTDLS